MGLCLSVLSGAAHAAQASANLSALELFAAADAARAEGREGDALAMYAALSRDPDAEVRAEARFRSGMLHADAKRYTQAAVAFRALLDEKPGAARVRLELARVLALMGDERGARRSLAQAQAAGLPADVAVVVDQFAGALRSTRTLGGSIELAVAPDSNVNRATAARTLDTVIAPLTLSRDARARSGLGAKIAGQGYARLDLGGRFALLPRVSTRANIYRRSAFNDVSGSALVGVEWQGVRDRVTPSIGPTWRWYGGDLYARTETLAIDWLRAIDPRTQLTMNGSASRARYVQNRLQDGGVYDLSLTVERALDARTGGSVSLSATRQTARDAGYATAAGGLTALGYREIGRATLFGSATIRRTEGDERLFLFPERRREWLGQLSAGATFRRLTWRGFAPVIRLTIERNRSSVGLYDYRRTSAEFGITRAF